MDNCFDIPLTYKSKEIIFPAEYISMGYSYKINVDVTVFNQYPADGMIKGNIGTGV